MTARKPVNLDAALYHMLQVADGVCQGGELLALIIVMPDVYRSRCATEILAKTNNPGQKGVISLYRLLLNVFNRRGFPKGNTDITLI